MSKKTTHGTPLEDEFPLTQEEDELMERVKAGKEPFKSFDNVEDLLDNLHS